MKRIRLRKQIKRTFKTEIARPNDNSVSAMLTIVFDRCDPLVYRCQIRTYDLGEKTFTCNVYFYIGREDFRLVIEGRLGCHDNETDDRYEVFMCVAPDIRRKYDAILRRFAPKTRRRYIEFTLTEKCSGDQAFYLQKIRTGSLRRYMAKTYRFVSRHEAEAYVIKEETALLQHNLPMPD